MLLVPSNTCTTACGCSKTEMQSQVDGGEHPQKKVGRIIVVCYSYMSYIMLYFTYYILWSYYNLRKKNKSSIIKWPQKWYPNYITNLYPLDFMKSPSYLHVMAWSPQNQIVIIQNILRQMIMVTKSIKWRFPKMEVPPKPYSFNTNMV